MNAEESVSEPKKTSGCSHVAVPQLLLSTAQVDVREGLRQVSAGEPGPGGGRSNDLFGSQNTFCPSGSISIKILNLS